MQKDQNGIWRTGKQADVSFPSDGNEKMNTVESSGFWFEHRNNVLIDTIHKYPFKGDYVDIGGGNGFQLKQVIKKIKPSRGVLIEPGYDGCKNAIQNGVDDVYCMTFEEFEWEAFQVGGIALLDVIEHIADDVEFLTMLQKKVPKGTLIYIMVPALPWLWSKNDEHSGHFRRYTKKSLRQLGKACSFEPLHVSYFFSYLTLPVFIFRSIPFHLGFIKSITKKNSTNQHKSKGFIRCILKIFGKLERPMIQKKIVPFGSSCLGVFKV